jgi:hypothetical protein
MHIAFLEGAMHLSKKHILYGWFSGEGWRDRSRISRPPWLTKEEADCTSWPSYPSAAPWGLNFIRNKRPVSLPGFPYDLSFIGPCHLHDHLFRPSIKRVEVNFGDLAFLKSCLARLTYKPIHSSKDIFQILFLIQVQAQSPLALIPSLCNVCWSNITLATTNIYYVPLCTNSFFL